jgi:1-phosphofructokinase
MKSVVTVTLNPALDRNYAVDEIKAGELNKALSVRTDAGGKGINVARALRRFGLETCATGFNGGFTGQHLTTLLNREEIPYDFVTVSGDTRINIKISDKNGITTELNEQGFTVSEGDLDSFFKKLSSLTVDARYLVLSGSIPKGVPAGIYSAIIRAYEKTTTKVILDSDNEPLKLGVDAVPFCIKPNLKELSHLSGYNISRDQDIVREARKLVERGITWVAVTMGERGAFLLKGDEVILAKPFRIRAQCTTGAGDAALAAFIYSMERDLSIEETAAYMTCTGTLSSALPGTSVCTLKDVQGHLSDIQLVRYPY